MCCKFIWYLKFLLFGETNVLGWTVLHLFDDIASLDMIIFGIKFLFESNMLSIHLYSWNVVQQIQICAAFSAQSLLDELIQWADASTGDSYSNGREHFRGFWKLSKCFHVITEIFVLPFSFWIESPSLRGVFIQRVYGTTLMTVIKRETPMRY